MLNKIKNLGEYAKKGAIPWNKGLKGFGRTHFLGKKHTEETKEKMRKSKIGKKSNMSEEQIEKLRERMKDNTYGKNNKGKVSAMKGKHHLEETKEKISNSLKGRTSPNKGHSPSKETRLKLSLSLRGKNGPNWKGGVTSINERIRKSVEYKLWRESVFKRDNYTCVFCGKREGIINADHIKPFALFPELRFAIDNGRTLCKECHKQTDTYGYSTKYRRKNEK